LGIVATFEDQSTPSGYFLRLDLDPNIELQSLAPSYNFLTSSYEGIVVNGAFVQRNVVSGEMARESAVPEPGTMALVGLALAIGAATRRKIAPR
jgi:hypothetical protein